MLIKTGVYGFLRVMSLVPDPPLWWGLLVLLLGVISGVLGVAFAIAQHDLKRLLAYHSVENIGIIFMGIGVALIGRSTGQIELVALGLAGALLHTWNHGLFKALLFLAAGSVIHATGTRDIDALGGLARRMRWTALWFLVGAVAICGLPPLNGFISELFVYLGLIDLTTGAASGAWLAGAVSAAALALIGGLAVACFVKVFGAVFLGEPRSAAVAGAHESPAVMTGPMAVLALLCFAIGVAAPLITPGVDHATAAWAPELATRAPPGGDLAPLWAIATLYLPLALLFLAVGLWLAGRARQAPARVGTWDCGYAAPSPRMQYTASSFGQMLVSMFGWALRPRVDRPQLATPFAGPARFATHITDTVLDSMIIPVARFIGRWLGWLRWVQLGSAHAYIFYILATLVVLLVWKGG
jgi:hydrogenase-4 component B